MRKGMAEQSIGRLFLVMLCAVIFSALLLLWLLPVGIPMVAGWLQDRGILPDGVKLSMLEKSILCAYYRCYYGCDSMPENYEICTMVDGACEPGTTRQCKEDFCDNVPDKVDNKVCDENAKTNPVVVELGEPAELKEKFWSDLRGDPRASIVRGDCETKYVNIVVPNSVDCETYEQYPTGPILISGCTFFEGTPYSFWMGHVPPFGYRSMVICDETPQFCSDSDGGHNLREKGICTDADGDNPDECTDDDHVNEFRCSDNGKVCIVQTTSCPEGSSCVDGACVNYLLPENPDDWTETQADIDCCWSGDPLPQIPNGLKLDEDSQSRVNSIYIETMDVLFSIYNEIVVPIDNLDDWDELRFWFKDTQSSVAEESFMVYFDAEDGGSVDKMCDLGSYDASVGWRKYTVNIADCSWFAGPKPIKSIVFSLPTPDLIMRSNIDGLYFCNGDGCQVDAPPPEETCDDSDGGNNVGEKGTCTDTSGSYTDSCKDSTTVTEYDCVNNACEPIDRTCPPGYVCVDGACETPVTFELFENDNFGGQSVSVTSPVSDLGDHNFDNKALSIKVPDGYKVTLYDEGGPNPFRGKEITIAGNSSSLWFGDRAKSIKIEGPVGCQATLYGDENYEGKEKVVTSDIADLELEIDDPPCCRTNILGCWWHCWDAVASSIKIEIPSTNPNIPSHRCKVTLYKDKNYGEDTGYIVLSGYSTSLHFENRASSLIGFEA